MNTGTPPGGYAPPRERGYLVGAFAAMIFVGASWGANVPVSKVMLEHYDLIPMSALRTFVATVVLGLLLLAVEGVRALHAAEHRIIPLREDLWTYEGFRFGRHEVTPDPRTISSHSVASTIWRNESNSSVAVSMNFASCADRSSRALATPVSRAMSPPICG